ncbi:MAG: glycosyltransferase family 4 protein [Lachnospiraceae bacterium]|jgi:glycosyltransferase involved in cell wall biosynthesis|nr:glycosyltransferase family 4 protein [Lachnospiraceae bacterium]
MKILFFSQFYTPESIAPSFRATENSRLWKEMGHDVTVFTGYPNYPKGKIFDGYDAKLLSEEIIDGVRVIRSKLVAVPNTSTINRLENALSYYFFGRINEVFQSEKIGKKYDVVLGTSGIIFNALLAQKYAAKHKIPFVFEIRDITYVQMQATGKRYQSMSVILMKKLELWLCKKASKIVVVTNGFKKTLIENGVPADKIEVITNGVDVEKSKGVYDEGKKFTLSYFGTLGLSQNIKDTFDYAKAINEKVVDSEYLIIGDGAQKEEVEYAAQKVSYVRMLPGMSAADLEPFYNDTQLSVITLRKTESFKYTIPSKLFQVMGRGIAILFIGPDGESADIIRKFNAGIALVGDKEDDLKILNEFFSKENWREQLKVMGNNGRKAVEEHYSRTKLAKKYIRILDAARK